MFKRSLRDKALKVLSRIPPLSAGASRFLAALAKRDVEAAELTAIIHRDPMLAPRVLELANSGVFGRLRRIESVRHAVALVGPATLRKYAIRWTIGGVFRSLPDMPKWSTSKFTMHSEATALLADALCDHMSIRGADGAFVAGLVHDIGKFVICAEADDAIDFIQSMHQMSDQSLSEIEREVLGIDHSELSSMAAQKWKLPDDVCEAVHWHHEPYRDPSPDDIPLSVVLSKADSFVNGLGLSFLSGPKEAQPVVDWPGYEDAFERALKSFATALKTQGVSL